MSKTELLVGKDEIVGDSGLFVDGDGQIVRGSEMLGNLTPSQRRARIDAMLRRKRQGRRSGFYFGPRHLKSSGDDLGAFIGRDEIVGDDSSLDIEEIMGDDSSLDLEEIMGSFEATMPSSNSWPAEP